MERNFLIRDAVAVVFDNEYFDLHNDFDFVEVRVFFGEKKVSFCFNRHDGEGVFFLNVLGVSHFSMSAIYSALGDRDVVEIGYKGPDDFDHDWLVSEEHSSLEDHLFIRLSGDDFIRVYGHSAKASMARD